MLGEQHATTLIDMLPERHDLATTEDLRTEIRSLRADMVTKDDLAEFATKDDLTQFATKDDLRDLRQEVAGLRTEMHKYVHTFVISQITAIVGVAGIVFGIVRLA